MDRTSGDFYLSIPVANRMIHYDEYFRLTRPEFEVFPDDGRDDPRPVSDEAVMPPDQVDRDGR